MSVKLQKVGAPVKINNSTIKALNDETFTYIVGRLLYKGGAGSMSEAAQAIYKELPNNCIFNILGIGDAHFIMTGFKHMDLKYGYCDCHDYWGGSYRFVEQGGTIKSI